MSKAHHSLYRPLTTVRMVLSAHLSSRPCGSSSIKLLLALLTFILATSVTTAFQAPLVVHSPHLVTTPSWHTTIRSSTTSLNVFGGKNKKNPKNKKLTAEELSYLETRDMTRDEMKALNKQNEDIMNAELAGMTIFSLVISLPLLYLAWVGFFADTAEIAGDLSPYAQ